MTQQTDVENRLREMILNLEISPGERITERWAEAAFGASRTPVRAALIRLANEGLVCREGRGWSVAPIETEEIRELFDYREALETSALRMSEGYLSFSQLQALTELVESDMKAHSQARLSQAGTEFHLALANLSGNRFITRSLGDVLQRLSRARWLDTGAGHDGWQEHRALVAALFEGDTTLALALLSAHIRASRDRTLDALNRSQRTLRARGINLT